MHWRKRDLIAVKTEMEQKQQQDYQEDKMLRLGRDNGQPSLHMEFKG